MSYRTLMIAPTLGHANAGLLGTTAWIARKLDAGVVGIAACRPIDCVCHDFPVPAGIFEADRRQIERQVRDAELAFRNAMAGLPGPLGWQAHTCLEPLAVHLADESVSADLVLIGLPAPGSAPDATRHADPCDLVMQTGRPVLLVPDAQPATPLDRVVVAWKDTREARRAAADALPLLAKAASVTVVAIEADESGAAARNSVSRVAAWLARHGVTAQTRVVASAKADGPALLDITREMNADLVVAGAVGHVRQGRWMLGGITDALIDGDRCVLLSH
jgi:nucleotide-binding universal stress UspA family protein